MGVSRVLVVGGSIASVLLAAAGCGERGERAERPERSYALPVDVHADTGRGETLRITVPPAPPPRAEAWLARVSPSPPALLDMPPAAVSAETLSVAPSTPPALAVDEALKPPIPRARTPLAVPARARGTVELDVRVDERGQVTDARWAGGSPDSLLVRAATDCALGMRFYPAQRAGRPVAVWCRERFDFLGAGSEGLVEPR